MRKYSYKAARRALQIMRDSNTRDDGGYNAACYEVMMNMAMEKKIMTRQGRMLQTPSGNCLWFINTQS